MKGTARQQQQEFTKSVGFGLMEVVAINPTREKLNKLFGKDDSDEDKEIEYLGKDDDDNTKVKITFWLKEQKTGKFFAQTLTLVDKDKSNKDGSKFQYINCVGDTAYADVEDNLPKFFTTFQNKNKEALGDKSYRVAKQGEEELAKLIQAWLGGIDLWKPDADIFVDTKKLFAGNFKQLQEQIGGEWQTLFVALTGVRTDKDDASKQYQEIYKKAYLPANFIQGINLGNKFSAEWARKKWAKFKEEVEGDYGYKGFTKLTPLQDYNRDEDPTASEKTKQPVEDGEGSGY